jgi:FkbM family methyltransferase
MRKGLVFVDIGANIGQFSLQAAKAGARVIAYEPTPSVFQRLRENIALNHLNEIQIVNAAVTANNGVSLFYESSADPEANSLFVSSERFIEVPTVTLAEDLMSRGIQKVHFIKIDAEGAELVIVRSIESLLRSEHPDLLVEVNPITLQAAGSTPEDLREFLQNCGYILRDVESISFQGEMVSNVYCTCPTY